MPAKTKRSTSAEVEAFASGLDEFTRALRTARGRFNRAPVKPELSASQFHLLEPLAGSDGPLAVCALADAAGVAAPTATRMLDGLARDGFVERRHSESDRRSVLVSLTERGEAAVENAHEVIETWRREVFERLKPEEREPAARLLARLAEVLEEDL